MRTLDLLQWQRFSTEAIAQEERARDLFATAQAVCCPLAILRFIPS